MKDIFFRFLGGLFFVMLSHYRDFESTFFPVLFVFLFSQELKQPLRFMNNGKTLSGPRGMQLVHSSMCVSVCVTAVCTRAGVRKCCLKAQICRVGCDYTNKRAD